MLRVAMWMMQMQVDVQSANAKEQKIFNLQSIVREGSGFRVQGSGSTFNPTVPQKPPGGGGGTKKRCTRARMLFSRLYNNMSTLRRTYVR
jgi:hypothetical protein